jgi:plastocyanin
VARFLIGSIQSGVISMNAKAPVESSISPRFLARRTALRLLAASPVTALAVAAGRTSIGRAIPAEGSPVARPVVCVATPLASPGSAIVVHTIYDPNARESADQLRFDPAHVTIKSGQTITWKNESQMPHTATGNPSQNPVVKSHPEYVQLPAGAEPWGSQMLQPGDSYSHTFTTPGEYRYICIPHVLSGMRGTVTVEC